MPGSGRPPAGETVAGGVINAFQAAYQAKRDAVAQREAAARLRSGVITMLDACHELIAEIEAGVGLDVAPPTSPIRTRYVRCLEARREVTEVLARPAGVEDLHRAHDLALRVLHELRATRQALLPPL